MKTALLTILTMTSFSGMAFAVDKSTDVNSGTYAVERMICSKLYVPATGAQSPNYQAGVNAQGQPVVPADVNPAAGYAPDYVEVPLTMDLAKRLGLNQAGTEIQMPVANLKLYKDGRIEYNGQDISSNASSMCGVGKQGAVQPAQPYSAQSTEKSSSQYSVPVAQQTSGNFAPHPSSNPNYVSPRLSKNMTAPAATPSMVEPAAGQDQMLAAPSTTVTPDTRNKYQSDSVAPDNVEPQAGSVASSATSVPAPKTPIQIQKSTVNMAPRTNQYTGQY